MVGFSKDAFDKRIHEIDFFRGLLIILVIFDHLMWFINYYIFHNSSGALNWYWTSEARYIVRQIVLCAFLFTCGISCHFSRNNKKRGLMLLIATLAIPLITHLIQLLPMFSSRVIAVDFNIIGVIALSILAYVLIENFDDKKLIAITGILIVFYACLFIHARHDTSLEYSPIKSILYVPFNPIRARYVGDYLPLFPYIIFLFIGVLFARRFYKEKKSLLPKKEFERPICFLGRHTLFIYIAHEILFTLIFMGLDALL